MGAVLVVGGAYFIYHVVKAKREKAAAIKEFESLPSLEEGNTDSNSTLNTGE